MLKSYRADLCNASSQHVSLANGRPLLRPLQSHRGRVRASSHRTDSGTACCAGLSQQSILSLDASSSLSSTVLRRKQHTCAPLHQLQPSGQATHSRDVRAHIRAPAIPALESQPYGDGTDKTSQLQEGRHIMQVLRYTRCYSYVMQGSLSQKAWDGRARNKTYHGMPQNVHLQEIQGNSCLLILMMQCCNGGLNPQSRQSGSGGALLPLSWAGRLQLAS